MDYKEIESHFQSDDGLETLLEYCQTNLFDRLDYHMNLFRTNALADPAPLQTTLDDLTGLYMELRTIYDMSCTEKDNREVKFYINKKIEVENKGDKFVSASTEKEASKEVANYRRVRNILEGKVEGCEKAISTCQSKLSYLKSEMGLSK